MHLEAALQHTRVAVQADQETHVLIEVTVPDVAAPRPQLHLALAIGQTLRTSDADLAATREAVQALVDAMAPGDRLALVTCDGDGSSLAELGPLDQPALAEAIAGLVGGAHNNLAGGWLTAVRELTHGEASASAIRRVILLTDAPANAGITEANQLEGVASSLARDGITTTTIGLGDDFDDLLTTLADAGGGNTHWARAGHDLREVVAMELRHLTQVVAPNLIVELRPTGGATVLELLNGQPSYPVPGGIQIHVGEAHAGETVRIVARLEVPAFAEHGAHALADVVAHWIGADGDDGGREVSRRLLIDAVWAGEADEATENGHVIEEVRVLQAGRRVRDANELAREGRLADAAKVARDAARELRGVKDAHPSATSLRAGADEIERIVARFEAGEAATADITSLHQLAHQVRMGRSSAP